LVLAGDDIHFRLPPLQGVLKAKADLNTGPPEKLRICVSPLASNSPDKPKFHKYRFDGIASIEPACRKIVEFI
jgi:hypothetical protein